MKDNLRNKKWLEDIEELARELPKRHKNLFFYKDQGEFYNEIEYLKTQVDYYDDYELFVQLGKIVASIRDAHTAMIFRVNLFCPFELYCFPEGIYFIGTTEEYSYLLFKKITKINGMDINEVVERVGTIISYENQSFLKAQLPKFLVAVELLYGLEIIDEFSDIEITFENNEGEERALCVNPITRKELQEKLIYEDKKNIMVNSLPLYRRKCEINYWFEYIEEHKTCYFKYNACREMEEEGIANFCNNIIDFINKASVDKLIIDLRNNYGGDSTLLEPFIEAISSMKRINKEESLFVIVGRETFSSALLNVYLLKEKTKAIFLGEPTGGKPNCYGEVQRFALKNSGAVIIYSTEYYKVIEQDEILSFTPDILIENSKDNYMNNEDAILKYIFG